MGFLLFYLSPEEFDQAALDSQLLPCIPASVGWRARGSPLPGTERWAGCGPSPLPAGSAALSCFAAAGATHRGCNPLGEQSIPGAREGAEAGQPVRVLGAQKLQQWVWGKCRCRPGGSSRESGRNATLAQGGYQPSLVTKPPAPSGRDHNGVLILHFLDLELCLHFCQGSKLSLPPCPCQVTSHPSEEEHHCSNLTQSRFPGNHQIHFPII